MAISSFETLPALLPQVQLTNLYGPTETCIDSLSWQCDSTWDEQRVPIGRPIANTQVYVLNPQHHAVPIGVAGELYIGGAGLARGYLNRPELTAEKFVTNPFSDDPASRLYRTGDRCRWGADGSLEFLGRLDDQVKLRGFRIELGEIQSVLNEHPDVAQSIVALREDRPGGKRLVAYCVSASESALNASELRSHLRHKLPDYMVPAAFVGLDSLPLTSNGKVNRRALPTPDDSRPELDTSYAAPRNPVEQQLAAIWCDILGVENLGIHDDFFAIGGHSLLAVSLFASIEREFGKKLPLATILQAPTVEQMAIELREGRGPAWSSLVPIQPKGAKPPFFCIHAVGGNVLFYRDLARHLGEEQPVYGLQAVGLDGTTEPLTSIEAMAAHYLEEIRTVQPHGPFYLGGHCLGADLALEMALQLQAQGEEVALLASLNTDGEWRSVHSFREGMLYHLRHLSQLGYPQKLLYVAQRIKYRGRRVWETMVTKVCRHLVQSGGSIPATLRHTYNRDVHSRANRRYVPGVFEGRLVLFRGSGNRHLDPHRFWGKVIAHGIDIVQVPGKGARVLAEPHVKVLAEKLKERLI